MNHKVVIPNVFRAKTKTLEIDGCNIWCPRIDAGAHNIRRLVFVDQQSNADARQIPVIIGVFSKRLDVRIVWTWKPHAKYLLSTNQNLDLNQKGGHKPKVSCQQSQKTCLY